MGRRARKLDSDVSMTYVVYVYFLSFAYAVFFPQAGEANDATRYN